MKYVLKIGRFLGISAIVLLLLFLLIYVLIQQPKVQTWVVKKVTTTLSERLETPVKIDKVDIEFFKTAVLEGIYMEDNNSDTLLYAEQLTIDIGLFALFQKKIAIDKIQLKQGVVNLSRRRVDSLFNYEVILQKLNTETSATSTVTPVDTTTSPWDFGISDITLEDVRFNMVDERDKGFALNTQFGILELNAKSFDIEQKEIDINELVLSNSSISYSTPKTNLPVETSELAFPNLGWSIKADQILLSNNQVYYDDFNQPKQKEQLDFSHLGLRNLGMTLKDLKIQDQQIEALLERATVRDASGFNLNNLKGAILLTNQLVQVKDLNLVTPNSRLNADLQLDFAQFGDLGDFTEKVRTTASILPSRLAYKDLRFLVPSLKNIPTINMAINETIALEGKINLEKDRLSLNPLKANISPDFVAHLDGTIDQLYTDQVFDIRIASVAIDYATLTKLTKDLPPTVKGIEEWGKITFSGDLKGAIDELEGSNLNFRSTNTATVFVGDLTIKGLPDIEQTTFKADIQELKTSAAELKGFTSTPLPPLFDSLGLVSFKGNFDGTIYRFDVEGDLGSSAGDVITDLNIDFNEDYSFASYKGLLEMNDFNLAKLLGKPFGPISLKATIEGEGLALEDLNSETTAAISSVYYQGYTYQDLKIDGNFLKKKFEGNAVIEDENVAFDFFGKVDLNDSLPYFNALLMVDTINLQPLNLYPQNLGFSGLLNAKIRGNSLDNLAGKAGIRYFSLTKDSLSYHTQERTTVKVTDKDQKEINIRSAFLDAQINGIYHLNELPNAIKYFVHGIFPISIPDSLANTKPPLVQNIKFDFQFKDIGSIAQVFIPELSAIDTAWLKGSFDNETNELIANGIFQQLNYNGFSTDTLVIETNGTANVLTTNLLLSEARYGPSINIPNGAITSKFEKGNLQFQVDIWQEEIKKLLLNGQVNTTKEKEYQLAFDPTMIINDTTWNIHTENTTFYDFKSLIISQLHFSKGNQFIKIDSKGETPAGDFAPIYISLSDFRLAEIESLLGMEEGSLKGNINGNLVVLEPLKNLHYQSNIQINQLRYEQENIGDLSILAEQEINSPIIDIKISLKEANELDIYGSYNISENNFDLDIDLAKLHLSSFDPFLKEIIENSFGELFGKIKLTGSTTKPNIRGQINLKDVSTVVVLSKMRYYATDAVVDITEQQIKLGTLPLKDVNENEASLSGTIRHQNFQNFVLNLFFKTDAFQVLRTKEEDNALYYGDLFIKSNVKITGPLEKPMIDIAATTLPNTNLSVQAFDDVQSIETENYIIFANPEFLDIDSLQNIEQEISNTYDLGFDLLLNLQVTEAATLNVIIDPETGDHLTSIGNADLAIDMKSDGNLSILGTYVIEQGKYSMVYEQLIKRDFEIEKGSNIAFNGDPLRAKFDITAIHAVRTTTLDLVKNEASEAELKDAQYRKNINVILKLAGDLDDPLVSFDITVPNNSTSTSNSSVVTNKLAALREDPNELNKQVFGLLFFNSFITANQSSSSGLADASEGLALSSVSKLLSNQLNKLADRYITGVEVNFGLESYQTGLSQDNTATQLQLNLSKNLFNDRLSIQAGTNLNLNSDGADSGKTDFSAIAGDFVLEYKLNEGGNYSVKVFHNSDYNVLEDANTSKTGVGIILRKSFNSKRLK